MLIWFLSFVLCAPAQATVISGIVMESSGMPLRYVLLTIVGVNLDPPPVTDRDGNYRFPDLRGGCYTVRAEYEGKTLEKRITAEGNGVTVDFTFKLKGFRPVATGLSPRTGTIMGSVKTANGRPICHVISVLVLPESGDSDPYPPIEADIDGKFVQRDLTLGAYKVAAEGAETEVTLSDTRPVIVNLLVKDR
jgi:hypothetical protein